MAERRVSVQDVYRKRVAGPHVRSITPDELTVEDILGFSDEAFQRDAEPALPRYEPRSQLRPSVSTVMPDDGVLPVYAPRSSRKAEPPTPGFSAPPERTGVSPFIRTEVESDPGEGQAGVGIGEFPLVGDLDGEDRAAGVSNAELARRYATPASAEPALPEDAPLWARVLNSRVVRTGVAALEPIQAYQDAFFAIVADSLDDSVEEFGGEDAETLSDLPWWARAASVARLGTLTPPEVGFAEDGSLTTEPGGVVSRYSQINWGDYAPFGAAPERPTSGAELMALLGARDDSVVKWGGIVLDVFADPLMIGGAFRAAGRSINAANRAGGVLGVTPAARGAARAADAAASTVTDLAPAATKLGAGDELIRLGDALDRMLSLAGPTKFAFNSLPGVRGWVDKRFDSVMTALRDPTGTILGSTTLRGGVAAGVDWLVSPRARGRLLMPDRVDGVALGERVVANTSMARQRADDVIEQATRQVMDLRADVFGSEVLPWAQRLRTALQGAPRAFRHAEDVPVIVRENMLKQAYTLMEEGGPLLRPGFQGGDVKAIRVVIDNTAELAADPRLQPERWESVFTAAQNEVRRTAINAGIKDEAKLSELAGKFEQLVTGLTEVDSRLAFEFSGYGLARERFMTRAVSELGITGEEAGRTWVRLMASRLQDARTPEMIRTGVDPVRPNLMDLRMSVNADGSVRLSGIKPGDAVDAVVDAAGNATRTGASGGTRLGDLLRDDELFTRLDLGEFIDSLADGHLKRAYGIWTADGSGFTQFLNAHKKGDLISNNLIDDSLVTAALEDMPDVLSAWNEFARATSPNAAAAGELAAAGARAVRDQGFMLNKHTMLEHLIEDGLRRGLSRNQAAAEASEAWGRVNVALTAPREGVKNPLDQFVLAPLTDYVERYRDVSVGRGGITGSQGVFGQRREIDEDYLSLLGEYRDPLLAIEESLVGANRVLPMQDFMRNTFADGVSAGYVLRPGELPAGGAFRAGDRKRPVVNGVTFDFIQNTEGNRRVYGAFAGKYVHPQLLKEINSVFKTTGPTSAAFTRVRNLITGGYLASPHIVVTNAIGATFAATIGKDGLNPLVLFRNMAETLPGIWRGDSEWLARMGERTRVMADEYSSMSRKAMQADKFTAAATGSSLRAAMSAFGGMLESWMKAPFGARIAGLDGFQLVEQWVRASAYKAHYEQLRAGARGSWSALDDASAAARAAERARVSAYDYNEVPKILSWARDYGLLMFPGFTYLSNMRNIEAAIHRPAGLAAYDRLGDAITNAILDPGEAAAFRATLQDSWMEDERYVPVTREQDGDGDTHLRLVPLNQLIPTQTFAFNSLAESLGQVGIYTALIDLLGASAAGGDAVMGARFGQQVFSPSSEGWGRAGEVAGFVYNSFAPAFARKLWSPRVGGDPHQGLVPAAGRELMSVVPLGPKLTEGVYSLEEGLARRRDGGLLSAVVGATIRSPQGHSLTGPIASMRQAYRGAKAQHDEVMREVSVNIARASGVPEAQAELLAKRDRLSREFAVEWREKLLLLEELEERLARELGR